MDKQQYLKELLDLAQRNPEYSAMVEYVIRRDFMPEMQVSYLPDGVNARTLNSRKIEISPESRGVGSIVHEMTHVADQAIANQYFDDFKKNRFGKNQFSDAFQKLVLNGRVAPGLMGINSEFLAKNKDYRTAPNEIFPHGVGNQVDVPTNPAPPHFDTTAAQEFMILLDLANRSTKKKK